MFPQARTNVVVQEVGDELMVYDLERDEAHCLEPLAARVWRLADGQTPVEKLVERLAREAAASPDPSPREADDAAGGAALGGLGGANLLVQPVEPPAEIQVRSRRQVIRRAAAIGGLAAASFAVTSIVAPTPAQAQSVVLPPPDPGEDM